MRIRGKLCETGHPATVTIDSDRIAEIASAGEADLGGEDVWIAPGFIDVQLNGYGGYDFNRGFWVQGEVPADTIPRIVELAARSGTAMSCPTICTNSREGMIDGLREVARACDGDARLARAIPAI